MHFEAWWWARKKEAWTIYTLPLNWRWQNNWNFLPSSNNQERERGREEWSVYNSYFDISERFSSHQWCIPKGLDHLFAFIVIILRKWPRGDLRLWWWSLLLPGCCFILEASFVWSGNTLVVGSFPARCFMKSILRRRLRLLYSVCGRQIGAISLLAANQFQPGYKLMQSDKSYSSLLLLGCTLYAILFCYRGLDDKSAKIEFVAAYQTGNKVPCCFHPLNWLYWHARQKNAFSRKKVLEVKEDREGGTEHASLLVVSEIWH